MIYLKKVAKLVLTHLLRTDKQKLTKAVSSKINSEDSISFLKLGSTF